MTAKTAAANDPAEEPTAAEELAVEEEPEAPTPTKAPKGPHVERVGSAGSSGDSLVFECSVGDFIARGADGEAAVAEHIKEAHKKR